MRFILAFFICRKAQGLMDKYFYERWKPNEQKTRKALSQSQRCRSQKAQIEKGGAEMCKVSASNGIR